MPEWEEPNAARSFCGEVTPLGRGLGLGLGLGLVNRRYFETATWEHLLGHEMGRFQYEQFVACMVERIRAKECSLDEIRSFVHLVASSANRDFLRLALPYLPELKEQ